MTLSDEKVTEYLNERIEIKKKQMVEYAKSHDYAYALREQEAMEECKKLLVAMGLGKEKK